MKKIIIALITIFNFSVLATNSHRICMLLPIKDSLDGAIAFSVFKDVENHLKESDWCIYKSNSEIMNIFTNYKKNLEQILENKNVLKVVSEKTKAGSLIKIKIENQIKGVNVSLKVIGDNGEDVYFAESTLLTTEEPTVIAQTIKNWLEVYEKNIPYDGKIIGVLGNQFTTDIGTERGVFQNNEVLIVRPIGKKRHPLLKEIVDFDTVKIGTGKIIFSNKYQGQGNIIQYDTKKKIKVDDWIIVSKQRDAKTEVKRYDTKENEHSFGKLGTVSLFLNAGKASATNSSTTTKKIGGTVLGLDLEGTIWGTRNIFATMNISKNVGTLKKEEGTLQNSSNSLSLSKFKFKAGYKYLPMGFFYGPQIDGYIGYSNMTYGLDTNTTDGFTEASFKGILLGTRGIVPIQNIFRMVLDLSFVFNPKYSEATTLYGKDDSASSYSILFGGNYIYGPNMTIDAFYEINSNKASFIAPERTYKLKDSTLKIGTTFTF